MGIAILSTQIILFIPFQPKRKFCLSKCRVIWYLGKGLISFYDNDIVVIYSPYVLMLQYGEASMDPIFVEYRMTLSVQYSKYFQDQTDACKPNSPIWILQYYFVEILTLGGRGISRLNFNSTNFFFGWEGDFYMSSRFMFQFQTRFARRV